ncbi:MAG: hypothetical protein FJW40_23445 [Acidobacteria bacterium]|nr:hypothetical protein [Acidobacteriota bacterium]
MNGSWHRLGYAGGAARVNRCGAGRRSWRCRRTVAQDEASCIVFGMSKKAIQPGGVREIVPLQRVGDGTPASRRLEISAPRRPDRHPSLAVPRDAN